MGFTDEMGMQTGANGRAWVWRYPEEEYNEDCCAATHQSGFRKIKVWGAIRWGKIGKLVVIEEKAGEGKMNANNYCKQILDGELFDFWQEGMEELGELLIMEDGAPYHRGAATEQRKAYGWVSWGPGIWPANSPDLNPIENLWHVLRANVKKRKPKALKKDDLIAAIKEEWENMDIKVVNGLIMSMQRRLKAVIKAKGGCTKY